MKAYRVKQGERIMHGLQTGGGIMLNVAWAHIYVDCMGMCEPQQSIGLRFDSNAEADTFSDDEAAAVFQRYGWTARPEGGFLCPKCNKAALDAAGGAK